MPVGGFPVAYPGQVVLAAREDVFPAPGAEHGLVIRQVLRKYAAAMFPRLTSKDLLKTLPLDTWQGPNSESAWQEMLAWASQWGSRQWGIEETGNYGAGLAQHLVAAGETVYEVNPQLTAQGCRPYPQAR